MTKSSRGARRQRDMFEISILVVAIIAVAAILAGLVAAGLGSDGPARLTVEIERVRAGGNGDVVELVVRNDGDATAEEVAVKVEAGSEEREVSIPRIAKRDEEEASVVLPAGSGASARAEVVGYSEP